MMNKPEKDEERIKKEQEFFEFLDRVGKIAEENGLTEEILNELIKEED